MHARPSPLAAAAPLRPRLPPVTCRPRDLQTRLAARRLFVDLKQRFMQAAALVDGTRGAWLQHELRQAELPEDLLRLRTPIFAALVGNDPARRQARHWLQRSLDSLYDDSVAHSGFTPF